MPRSRPRLSEASGVIFATSLSIVLWLLIAFAIVSLFGCATYEVATTAPADFWLTLERLVMAVAEDIWTVIDWLL